MSTENILCKADIRVNKKIYTIFAVLMAIFLILLILVFIPVEKYSSRNLSYTKNIFGSTLTRIELASSYPLAYHGDDLFETIISFSAVTVEALLFIIPIILGILFIIKVDKTKQCSLSLTSNGINGQKKDVFSKKLLDIPFENITSIMVIDSLIGKLCGGKTLGISSATGTVKMICVQNAQEFVDMTLAELKKYKESVSNNSTQQAVVNEASDEADKLMKLKNLLEQGLISQEEFEQKRKELISRM